MKPVGRPMKIIAKCNSEMGANKTIMELPTTNRIIARHAEEIECILLKLLLADGLA